MGAAYHFPFSASLQCQHYVDSDAAGVVSTLFAEERNCTCDNVAGKSGGNVWSRGLTTLSFFFSALSVLFQPQPNIYNPTGSTFEGVESERDAWESNL